MKKGNDHSLRKVRNNKVKKKRKTMKRKSTYKRKKNKNKKRSIKQKGGNLEKILAVGAGTVLAGALTAVFAKSSFNSNSFTKKKKHNKNSISHENDNVAESPQHPPVNQYESITYRGGISIEEIIDFSRLYFKGPPYDDFDDEEYASTIADKKDYFFLGVWHSLITNFNQFIKIIEVFNHNTVDEYFQNIDQYIISQDLQPYEREQIKSGKIKVNTLDDLIAVGKRGNRKPDGFIKSFINYIIFSIFLIELNKKDNPYSMKYSDIFTISKLQDAINLIRKKSKSPKDFEFTVDEKVVEKIFDDSLKTIKEMDDNVKKNKELIDGDDLNISGVLLNQLLEKRFPKAISDGLFDYRTSKEDMRPTKFYEDMIERNKREMTQN